MKELDDHEEEYAYIFDMGVENNGATTKECGTCFSI